MGQLIALDLQLQLGLFLRTHIDGDADDFEQITILLMQTPASHNNGARFAIGRREPVLAFKSTVSLADFIEDLFHLPGILGMDAREQQFAGQRQIDVESINAASLFIHPRAVLPRVKTPESNLAGFRGKTDPSLAFPDRFLRSLSLDREAELRRHRGD